MRTRVLVLMVLGLLVGAGAAGAALVNGGFESGDFSGWGTTSAVFSATCPPNGNYIGYGDRGFSAVVTPGTDPIVGHINQVYNGNYAVRLNKGFSYYGQSPNSYASFIYPVGGGDNLFEWNAPRLYFAWAAVWEEPGGQHDYLGSPHFRVSLYDMNIPNYLYYQTFSIETIDPSLLHSVYVPQTGTTWQYTDWQVSYFDTSSAIGHELQIVFLASGCIDGQHSGYAYFDAIGDTQLPQTTPVPGTIILLGSGLAGLAVLGRRRLLKRS